MEKDDVIRKIKHCLALSKSDNPTEAATALRQAQKLMAQYNVSGMEVSFADVSEAAAKAFSTALLNWEAALATIVAEAFGCQHFTRHGNRFNNQLRQVRFRNYIFVGIGANPEIAQYAFEVLLRQCVSARKKHINAQSNNCKLSTKTARGDEFALGWVDGVERLVQRFAGSEHNQELVQQYIAQKYPDMRQLESKDRTVGKNTKSDWWAGKQAAKDAQLDRGVGTRKQERLS